MCEIWREVVGYEGLYAVSSHGRIFGKKKNKHLSFGNGKAGYQLVGLCKNGIRKNHQVHRLVATAFIENSKKKKVVNHIDGDKHNNVVGNLRWSTMSENRKHAYDVGLQFPIWGERSNFAKLKSDDVIYIRELYKNKKPSMASIASMYSITIGAVYLLLHRKTWSHL